MKQRVVVSLCLSVAALLLVNFSARAQVCGGASMVSSTLQYIVRDAKGVAIDAAQKDLQVAKSDSSRGGWAISSKDFIGSYEGKWNIKTPETITNLVGKVSVIKASSSPMCNFAAAQTLQLTLGGKTMRLIFLTPHLPQYQSVEFLVDAIPFQEGIFSIELPTVPDGEPKFYEAGGWKKITEAEEAFIQAEASLRNRDYEKAVQYFKRAAALKPNDPLTLRLFGYAYLQTKQYVEALATLQQAVTLNPTSAITYGSLGRAYWLNDKNKEAVDAYAKGLSLCPKDKECDEDWANEARDDLRKALTAYDANSPKPPADAQGYFDDGYLHFVAQMNREAVERFQQATRLDPKYVWAFRYLGITYDRLDKHDEAIAALKEAIRLEPDHALTHGLLGEVFVAAKRNQEAVTSFKEAMRLDPKNQRWQDDLKAAQNASTPAPITESKPQQSVPTNPGRFVKVDPNVLDQYVGQYQMPATESHQAFVLTVLREGEKLMSEAFGRRAEFLPYSDTEFYMREEDVNLRFVRDAQGKVTHIDWGGTIVKKIK
jgi:tetratricopeptide (TPR) repeat protein